MGYFEYYLIIGFIGWVIHLFSEIIQADKDEEEICVAGVFAALVVWLIAGPVLMALWLIVRVFYRIGRVFR